jgi:hypothetical protein
MEEPMVANASDQALEAQADELDDLGDAAEKKQGNNLMDWYGQD